MRGSQSASTYARGERPVPPIVQGEKSRARPGVGVDRSYPARIRQHSGSLSRPDLPGRRRIAHLLWVNVAGLRSVDDMLFRQLLNDETACGSYLLGCKTRSTFAVSIPRSTLWTTRPRSPRVRRGDRRRPRYPRPARPPTRVGTRNVSFRASAPAPCATRASPPRAPLRGRRGRLARSGCRHTGVRCRPRSPRRGRSARRA